MIEKLNKEMLAKLMDQANSYSNAMIALHKASIHPATLKSEYIKGVLDGIDNTSYTAFMAGAKAMFKILNNNEQTD